MKKDCIFCKIASKDVPSKIVYEDKDVLAFYDIKPQAPVHVIIIPKKHIDSVSDISPEDTMLGGELILSAKKIALQLGIQDSGYRAVFNCNKDAGQEVFHLHLHLLGGRKFTWPPG